MNRKEFKSHFKFNKQERSGIFFLLLLIVVFQIPYLVWNLYPTDSKVNSLMIDGEYQAKIEELKRLNSTEDSWVLYPFNPNFISDYKGYALGMSTEEIDRLHAFRAHNQFANSEKEFQKVTLISDSLLKKLAPYFKFPEWIGKDNKPSAPVQKISSPKNIEYSSKDILYDGSHRIGEVKDLNQATAEELKLIKGIGEKLSERIVKFRDRLGGFVVEKQLSHVYGLDAEVVSRILNQFKIMESPRISKININKASPNDIAQLVYIKYEVATRIVAYRDINGGIASFDELSNIEDFPSEKLDIIELYLQL